LALLAQAQLIKAELVVAVGIMQAVVKAQRQAAAEQTRLELMALEHLPLVQELVAQAAQELQPL
jgi:ABC-type branched-subunit amino acid transport system substrate-binding protein